MSKILKTCSEFTEVVFGVRDSPFELRESPPVVVDIPFVFRIDCIYLPIGSALSEKGFNKELGESKDQLFILINIQESCHMRPVEGSVQKTGRNIEVEVGMRSTREGIGSATVSGNVFTVIILFGILLNRYLIIDSKSDSN